MFENLLTTFFPAGGWAYKLGKWLLSKLTLRNIAILIALIAIAYGQYRFYNWAQDRQYQEDKVAIDKITKNRDTWKGAYQTYKSAFETWQQRSKTANDQLKADNAKIVADIETRLKAEEARSAELRKKLKHEIANRIPPAVDTDLPRGFVRLWNDSLEGETGTAPAAEAGLAYGLGEDAGRASGLKLSAFAGIGIDNNQECVIRGQVIREWQGWYWDHKALFDKVQKMATDAIPVAPADLPPTNAVPTNGQQGSR